MSDTLRLTDVFFFSPFPVNAITTRPRAVSAGSSTRAGRAAPELGSKTIGIAHVAPATGIAFEQESVSIE